jgi:hypothetical protein
MQVLIPVMLMVSGISPCVKKCSIFFNVVVGGSIIVHNLSSLKKGGHFQNIMPARRADG